MEEIRRQLNPKAPELFASQVRCLSRSLFSLAYLQLDLDFEMPVDPATEERWNAVPFPAKNSQGVCTVADLFKQFPRWKKAMLSPIGDGSHPPLQIMFATLKEEKQFIEKVLLVSEISDAKVAYERLYAFYKNIDDAVRAAINKPLRSEACSQFPTVGEVIARALQAELMTWWQITPAIADANISQMAQANRTSYDIEYAPRPLEDANFHYKIRLKPRATVETQRRGLSVPEFTVHIVCLPSREHLKCAMHEAWGFTKERWQHLQVANCDYLEMAPEEKPVFKVMFKGEVVDLFTEEREGESGMRAQGLPHLLTDRLAARRQAFAFALGVDNFGGNDALMVSWAAVEIGKLIERQISYRGNHLQPAVPLTAMEFCRLPISSLSFVDDVRTQYIEGLGVREQLLHHLRNEIHLLGFDRSIGLTARVKEFRSYFERLSERHPKVEHAIVTVWLYLLAFLDIRIIGTGHEQQKDVEEARGFIDDLKVLPDLLRSLPWRAEYEAKADRAVESTADGLTAPQAITIVALEKIKAYFLKHGSELWGDLLFLSPFLDIHQEQSTHNNRTASHLDNALHSLLQNLEDECYLPANVEGERMYNAKGYLDRCERIMFRNHDPFVRFAFSLLSQLENRLKACKSKHEGAFEDFYRGCCMLKDKIADADGILEGEKSFDELKQCVLRLRSFLLKCDTDRFVKMVSTPSPGRGLFLGVTGLYKRARMALNVHWHQRPPKELGWELGKLDYVGARLDCLFKNQVFAAYESIWGRADPFFRCFYRQPHISTAQAGHRTLKPGVELEGFLRSDFDPVRRQQMLALRTEVHQDDVYHATQITALMDPSAIGPGHWGVTTYDLSRLSFFLGAAFCYFDPCGAKKYVTLNYHRQMLRERYVQWFKMVNNLLARKGITEGVNNTEISKSRWFGTYLGEAAIDFLIAALDAVLGRTRFEGSQIIYEGEPKLLSKAVEVGVGKLFELLHGSQSSMLSGRRIATILKAFVEKGYEYSEAFWNHFHLEEKAGTTVPLPDGLGQLAMDLYDFVSKLQVQFTNHEWELNQRKHIAFEIERFGLQGGLAVYSDSDLPQVFFSLKAKSQLVAQLAYLDHCLQVHCVPRQEAMTEHQMWGWLRTFRDVLVELQRKQSEYLTRGLEGKHSHRGKKHAFERVLNYTLLFRADENQLKTYFKALDEVVGDLGMNISEAPAEEREKRPRHFAAWTAYDLFHYVRGLIPVEIQVRTQLSSTMAEQYHNPVYKARPPKTTTAQRERMTDIGRELDELDKEMDVLVEDYINHWLDEADSPT